MDNSNGTSSWSMGKLVALVVALFIVFVVLYMAFASSQSVVLVPSVPPVPEYKYHYYPDQDMRSNILAVARDKTNNISALKDLCNAKPECVGFNSYGYLRKDWLPDRLVSMTSGRHANDPLYQNIVPGVTGVYQKLM